MNRRTFLQLSSWGAGLALAGSYPIFVERYLIKVNHYTLSLPRLPDAFNGFTIVHLTDLHYGLLVPYGFIQKVIDRANGIPCDMIVCTGDYVHERGLKRQINTVWPLLMRLKAPCGVFSVLGNHDHWADTARSITWLRDSGQDLRKKTTFVEKQGQRLWLAGAGDLWEDHQSIDKLVAPIPADECRIVLAHNPDTADTVEGAWVDLFICGHTHGGQVNIPYIGTPIVPVKNKNYNFGLKTSLKNQQVFISRGIGWAIIPVRFNCFPEIPVVTLVNGKSPDRSS